MKLHALKSQTGYVLLLMLLAFMGIGGVVIAGFTQGAKQEVEHEKFLHNKRVLREAKQALLQFAYNYPVITVTDPIPIGPGRLPCADIDNDGQPDTAFGDCEQLGRLAWRQPDLNLYDIRDADGQRLWYVVSDNFGTNVGPNNINSDKLGSITIRDQVGNFIYDASLGEGVAAVIIAPGAPTARNGVAQDRDPAGEDPFDIAADTVAGIIDPVNYLDLFFGIEDNAQLAHDGADGFILGRVDDLTSASIIVNDQVEVITTAEVIEVAQRATLQAYQDAINNYQQAIWGPTVANYRYPWLDDYSTTDLTEYDGDVGTRLGRVPSLFGEYFVNTNPADTESLSSALTMDLNIAGFAMTETIPAAVVPDLFFRTNGNLSSSFNNGYTIVRYYWDGHATNLPSSLNDGVWEICPVVTADEEDCNQNGANNFIGGGVSIDWMEVRRVTVVVDDGGGAVPFEFPFGDKMATALAYAQPTAGSHATVTAEYNNGTGYLAMTWSQDDDFQTAFTETPVGNNGVFAFNVGVDSFTVGLTYYPELPNWAYSGEDDWHDSVQLAISGGYQPGAVGACGGINPPCLTVNNSPGPVDNDRIAVLTLAADHNLFPDNLLPGYTDDLPEIFEGENNNADDVFDLRVTGGNDKILVIR